MLSITFSKKCDPRNILGELIFKEFSISCGNKIFRIPIFGKLFSIPVAISSFFVNFVNSHSYCSNHMKFKQIRHLVVQLAENSKLIPTITKHIELLRLPTFSPTTKMRMDIIRDWSCVLRLLRMISADGFLGAISYLLKSRQFELKPF